MKAIVLKAYGGMEQIEYGDLPDPRPGSGAVLVRVRFCTVNPLDLKISTGALSPVSGLRFPRALGSDFSGTVVEVGARADHFPVGAEVYGHANIMFGAQGALAEVVCVPAKNLRLRPPHLAAESAACLPVAGTTALNGLMQCGELAGKHVIVAGASGGVGHLVVQLAKARGASVIGTAGAGKEQFVRELGADMFADYRSTKPAELGPAWVFFDAFGSTPFPEAKAALTRGGLFVSTLPSPGLMLRKLFGARIRFANAKMTAPLYQELEERRQAGELGVHIAHTLNLDEGLRALRLLEQGGSPGKILVRVGG